MNVRELKTTLRLDREGGTLEDTVVTLAPGFRADETLNCVIYSRDTMLRNVRGEGYREWRNDNLRWLRVQNADMVHLEDVEASGFSDSVVELDNVKNFVTRGRVNLFNGHQALSFGQVDKEVQHIDAEGLFVHDSWGPCYMHDGTPRSEGKQRRDRMGATCASGVPGYAHWKGLVASGNGNACFKYGKSSEQASGRFEDCVFGGVMFDEADKLIFLRSFFSDLASRYKVDAPTTDVYYQVDGGRALAAQCRFVAVPGQTRHAIHLHRRARMHLHDCEILGSVLVRESEGANLTWSGSTYFSDEPEIV